MAKSLNLVRAIAFDLDGTLIDSVPSLAQAASAALVDLGRAPCSELAVRGWIGNGARMLMHRALSANVMVDPALEGELLEQALARFHHHYGRHSEVSLYPQVVETIEQLAQRGYRMALITNKPARYLPQILASTGLAPYFELTLGGDSLPRCKPDPMPLQQVLTALELTPEQMVMVGDSRNDIEAAKAAGCPSIGLTYGYNYGEPLSLVAPDHLLNDFDTLLALLPALEENRKHD